MTMVDQFISHARRNLWSRHSHTKPGRRSRLLECSRNWVGRISLSEDGLLEIKYLSMKLGWERLLAHSFDKFLSMVILPSLDIVYTLCLSFRLFHQALQQNLRPNGREWSCTRYLGQSPFIRKNLERSGSSFVRQQHNTHWIRKWPSCVGYDSWPTSHRSFVFLSDWTHAVGSCWPSKLNDISAHWLWQSIN